MSKKDFPPFFPPRGGVWIFLWGRVGNYAPFFDVWGGKRGGGCLGEREPQNLFNSPRVKGKFLKPFLGFKILKKLTKCNGFWFWDYQTFSRGVLEFYQVLGFKQGSRAPFNYCIAWGRFFKKFWGTRIF